MDDLEVEEVAEEIVEEVEEVEENPATEEPEQEEPQEEEEELVVTFGDEEPEQQEEQDTSLVKHLRKTAREQKKRIRELEKLAKPEEPELRNKPTLEDHDWDAESFEPDLVKWHEEKRELEKKQEKVKQQEEEANKAWQEKLLSYQEQKTTVKLPNFQDAEENVLDNLSETQQAIILKAAKKPVYLVAALGSNQAKLEQLAQITDPIDFALAAAEMERNMNVKPKRKPKPEKTVVATASSSGTDSTLNKLRAEAAQTGDFTKVMEYRRKKKL